MGARQERRDRPKVHALLRPARSRQHTGLCTGLSHPVHPVRRCRRAARARTRADGAAALPGCAGGPALWRRPAGRHRRRRSDVPAAGPTGGVRLAPRPRGHYQGPAGHVEEGWSRRSRPARWHRCQLHRRSVMSTPGEAETTYGRWPDDDRLKGQRRRDAQSAAARGLRRGRDQVTGLADLVERGIGGRRGGGDGERAMVPEATFTSYYGRPVVKPSPWKADIPAYFFLGGVAAGSSLLGAGADLTDRPALRRASRLGALAGISLSMAALVHDLGRPSRFLNMQRVVRPTSPMSVGTWVLSLYGPLAGRGRG